MEEKQSNKNGQKLPEFTVTPYIGFFDIYFRTNYRIQSALENWCNNLVVLPTNGTDECDCRLCTTEIFVDSYPDPDIFSHFEVYLSHYQLEDGYRAVARFKGMYSSFVEDLMRDHFQHDEFFIKKVQYVFDFESKKQEDLLELITESIKIDLNGTVYENIHTYVETCEIAESKEPIIRLNIVVNYPISKTELGVFRDTEFETNEILDCIKFCTFDQDAFLSALTNQCMQITDSQMESIKKQFQDTSNMKVLRKIISRYVNDDSQCFKAHPLQSLFEKGIPDKDLGENPPSYDTKMVVLNTEPDIIPELEYYLPEFKTDSK
ncbi:MAG: hypothetical protein K8R53_06005 [Bacteroidales bacterium]|nr:hypothetical protein [Bacteroidales bacterium]